MRRRLTREERRMRREQLADALMIGGIVWLACCLVWIGFVLGRWA